MPSSWVFYVLPISQCITLIKLFRLQSLPNIISRKVSVTGEDNYHTVSYFEFFFYNWFSSVGVFVSGLQNQTRRKANIAKYFRLICYRLYWEIPFVFCSFNGKAKEWFLNSKEWLVARQKRRHMATTTLDLRKMSTKIFIVLSATTFLKNPGCVKIMNTSFVLLVFLNIYV